MQPTTFESVQRHPEYSSASESPLSVRFGVDLATGKASQSTVKTYLNALYAFRKFLASQSSVDKVDDSLLNARSETIKGFHDYCLQMGYEKATMSLRMATVNRFYRWLQKEDLVKDRPKIPHIQLKIRERQLVTRNQLEPILQLVEDNPSRIRRAALIELMISGVLKLGTVATYTIGDAQTLLRTGVFQSSGGPASQACLNAVARLVRYQVDNGKNKSHSLFSFKINSEASSITPRSVRRTVLADLGEYLGIKSEAVIPLKIYELGIRELAERNGGYLSENILETYSIPRQNREVIHLGRINSQRLKETSRPHNRRD